jgi:acetyl esterase/lipase
VFSIARRLTQTIMNKHVSGRRDFLIKMTALGAAGSPLFAAVRSQTARSADATTTAAIVTRYDPAATFEVTVRDVELRRTAAGRMLMARVYQPKGAGPFPTILDLHGGAWNAKDRHAEEPMDRALAASGVLVVAIDMTLAPEAPYPACVQDANYGVRWLKWKAASWNGDGSKIGVSIRLSGESCRSRETRIRQAHHRTEAERRRLAQRAVKSARNDYEKCRGASPSRP